MSQRGMQMGFPLYVLGDQVPEWYRCGSCSLILRTPVYLSIQSCGHRFCNSCMDMLLKYIVCSSWICPICEKDPLERLNDAGEPIATDLQIYPDNAIKREMAGLQAACFFENCAWSGTLRDFESHVEDHDKFCRYEKFAAQKVVEARAGTGDEA